MATWDHPRSRGVYIWFRFVVAPSSGSSPLARGLRRGGRPGRRGRGIIPARAGFTAAQDHQRFAVGDHPRSRGVYRCASRGPAAGPGSSPLARGLQGFRIRIATQRRIIPARAGFTRRSRARSAATADHPRSRGVYTESSIASLIPSGSSPLARGLRGFHAPHHRGRRIIPARAGFTCGMRPARAGTPDHPRSRGVYLLEAFPAIVSRGSSPLARGLPALVDECERNGRIIPARAGFTGARVGGGSPEWDHPRSRGVYPPTRG